MNKNTCEKIPETVHFIGVGGISMSALAKYCITLGLGVSGSDRSPNAKTEELKSLGAEIVIGHRAENVRGKKAAVYSSAVSDNNPELEYARKNGLKVYKRSEFLGLIISRYKYSVCVAGCHGKTTVCAMLTRIFLKAGIDVTSFIGGDDALYSNFRKGESEYVIAEACEFRKNLDYLNPTHPVVLNIDDDHLDSYLDMNELYESYEKFAQKGVSTLNFDDAKVKRISNIATVSFALKSSAAINASGLKETDGAYSFDICEYGRKQVGITLKVRGEYNAANAIAAAAAARALSVDYTFIKDALESYENVKRRFELLGYLNGTECRADYAHHPTELRAVLDCADKDKSEDFLVVFQPHTFSRTRLLSGQFISVLSAQKNVVIYKTYAAREKNDEKNGAFMLYERLKEKTEFVRYCDSFSKLKKILNSEKKFRRVLFLGAGDIYEIALKLPFNDKIRNDG